MRKWQLVGAGLALVTAVNAGAQSANSSETRLQLRAPHTSVRRLSSSISTVERWMIFARGIYASLALGIWASTWRSKHCSACCVPGEFVARDKPRRIARSFGYAGRNPFEKEEERLGAQDCARLRQLQQGSRRGKGRDDAPELLRRPPRLQTGGSLRQLRRRNARERGRPSRPATQVGDGLSRRVGRGNPPPSFRGAGTVVPQG